MTTSSPRQSGRTRDAAVSAPGIAGIAFRAARMPLGRIGSPDQIADAAVVLAAADWQQITGRTFHANGGDFLYCGNRFQATDLR